MNKTRMITVTVCVGSSCHVKGARIIIERFNDLLRKNGLENKVELKGCFCMERCGEGLNWQIDDEALTSATAEDAVNLFEERVVSAVKKAEEDGRG